MKRSVFIWILDNILLAIMLPISPLIMNVYNMSLVAIRKEFMIFHIAFISLFLRFSTSFLLCFVWRVSPSWNTTSFYHSFKQFVGIDPWLWGVEWTGNEL